MARTLLKPRSALRLLMSFPNNILGALPSPLGYSVLRWWNTDIQRSRLYDSC